ncbi:DUF1614 domain-containing protein [Geoglobus acetivorans]|uniref:DUF1614 domain-containing protein n=1 Tax=Geoglobus acetivorans TaxID=565033 RepID=A0ABZ3GZR4_GEOAI|nr:DUF1614 domain-containing protein [Geoglobus acetivorans]
MREYLFPPLILPLFIVIILLPFFAILFAFGATSALSIVLGMSVNEAMIIFTMIVIGSLINIPVYEKAGRIVERRFSFFGLIYSVRRREKIVVAVNVGGCLIPSFISLKLLSEVDLSAFLLAFFITSAVTYMAAKPVPGVGITVPMLIPPLTSALASYLSVLLFSLPLMDVPRLAFASGVLGSLFGADVFHLKDLEKIGSGVVSIGGAGTFDGIFLTGLFSVLFAVWLM